MVGIVIVGVTVVEDRARGSKPVGVGVEVRTVVTMDDDGLAVVPVLGVVMEESKYGIKPGVGVVELDTRNGVWPVVGGATVVVVERR